MRKIIPSMLAIMAFSGTANATNGYFSHGYGMKAKGMGGTATALAHDTFGGANNPASMVWVGDRVDVGLDLFSPIREAKRVGGGVPFDEESDSNLFAIPEFGYNHTIRPDLAFGVTVYGNGGMNTNYNSGASANCGFGPANPLCGSRKLEMDMAQLIIAPTLAYKVSETQSIGISPLFAYQRFKVNGLQAFAQLSSDPANLTNHGYDYSHGWGVRVGWQGQMTDKVRLGAAYSSKVRMDEFDSYRGLFADQGDFDIPENFNVGIAIQATPQLTLALDYQRINYSEVNSVSDSSQTPGCTPNPPFGPGVGANCLGGHGGIGFGWQDANVFKVGVEYRYDDQLTLRAGYNHGDNPIRGRDVTFNIIAPGVVQDHLTLGATYGVNQNAEVTVAYMHAFENSVSGATNPTYFPVGGRETIKMYENSLGIAFSWQF